MFRSKVVPWGQHKAAPFNTPGFRLDLPKFWSCKGRDIENEWKQQWGCRGADFDDEVRDLAQAEARAHARCRWPHLAWHGSLTYFFPLTSRIHSIKLWYMGSPWQNDKIFRIRKREDCYFCDKPACSWKSVRYNNGNSTSYSACLEHCGRDGSKKIAIRSE